MTSREESGRDFESPDVFESVLDADGLDALFRDLSALADIEQIRVRQGRGQDATVTLEEAREALLGESPRPVQIRYRHEGSLWCDTLIRFDAGVRIVRVLVPSEPPS